MKAFCIDCQAILSTEYGYTVTCTCGRRYSMKKTAEYSLRTPEGTIFRNLRRRDIHRLIHGGLMRRDWYVSSDNTPWILASDSEFEKHFRRGFVSRIFTPKFFGWLVIITAVFANLVLLVIIYLQKVKIDELLK